MKKIIYSENYDTIDQLIYKIFSTEKIIEKLIQGYCKYLNNHLIKRIFNNV